MLRFKKLTVKNYWIIVSLVYVTILSTLFIGQPLANVLLDQNIQAVIFVLGLFLAATVVVIHGIIQKPSGIEYILLIGIIAIYVMFFFRLGAPERSHLIEYSVLAIFLHKTFKKHFGKSNSILKPALYAWLTGLIMGFVDEGIQYFLPSRVFDPVDIVFNGAAVTMSILAALIISWLRLLYFKKSSKQT